MTLYRAGDPRRRCLRPLLNTWQPPQKRTIAHRRRRQEAAPRRQARPRCVHSSPHRDPFARQKQSHNDAIIDLSLKYPRSTARSPRSPALRATALVLICHRSCESCATGKHIVDIKARPAATATPPPQYFAASSFAPCVTKRRPTDRQSASSMCIEHVTARDNEASK
uniref:Uncharacterized protein n=1 Tax=Plectus sambesii TaxID=2011161 RepID=A0A914WY65_9BILA